MSQMEQTNIAKLIILLVALVFLLIFVSDFLFINSAEKDLACAQSVEQYAAMLQGVFEVTNEQAQKFAEDAINCPAKRISLSGSDDAMKKTIAEDMRSCFKRYGEGELDLFGGQKAFCSVCSIIEFEDKDDELRGLPNYMFNTIPFGEELTYYELLSGVTTDEDALVAANLADQAESLSLNAQLTGDIQYATVFYHVRGNTEIERVVSFMGSTNGYVFAAGVVLSVATANPFLAVVGLTAATIADATYDEQFDTVSFVSLEAFNPENINSMCDIIPVKVIEE